MKTLKALITVNKKQLDRIGEYTTILTAMSLLILLIKIFG